MAAARMGEPSRPESRDRKYDRYAPGPHHLAFHAESREVVDAVHRAMLAADATVLDPPTDYGGQPGYAEGYYAVFFADPDGIKLEVAHIPRRTAGGRVCASSPHAVRRRPRGCWFADDFFDLYVWSDAGGDRPLRARYGKPDAEHGLCWSPDGFGHHAVDPARTTRSGT
jgi:hypothetical protein